MWHKTLAPDEQIIIVSIIPCARPIDRHRPHHMGAGKRNCQMVRLEIP
ncbi:MAG: hypothetical protein QNL45_01850 [Nitrospirota bacterium]|nr:hypothetical protein [Nitrospirota bacterium]